MKGTQFARVVVDNILNEILLNYPGFTVANSVGYWKGSGRTYVEQNYQVLIDSVPDNTRDSASSKPICRVGRSALERQEPFAIIGTYEFQLYILDRSNRRCFKDCDSRSHKFSAS